MKDQAWRKVRKVKVRSRAVGVRRQEPSGGRRVDRVGWVVRRFEIVAWELVWAVVDCARCWCCTLACILAMGSDPCVDRRAHMRCRDRLSDEAADLDMVERRTMRLESAERD